MLPVARKRVTDEYSTSLGGCVDWAWRCLVGSLKAQALESQRLEWDFPSHL